MLRFVIAVVLAVSVIWAAAATPAWSASGQTFSQTLTTAYCAGQDECRQYGCEQYISFRIGQGYGKSSMDYECDRACVDKFRGACRSDCVEECLSLKALDR